MRWEVDCGWYHALLREGRSRSEELHVCRFAERLLSGSPHNPPSGHQQRAHCAFLSAPQQRPLVTFCERLKGASASVAARYGLGEKGRLSASFWS